MVSACPGATDRVGSVKAIAVLAGSLLALSGSGIAAADVPVGPGPTDPYTVQPQPAPGSCHYRNAAGGETLPDPACTPGATNPQVTPQTLYSTVCVKGYSASIRPPRAITDPEKRASAAAYGYTGSLADTEFDHLLSGATALATAACAA